MESDKFSTLSLSNLFSREFSVFLLTSEERSIRDGSQCLQSTALRKRKAMMFMKMKNETKTAKSLPMALSCIDNKLMTSCPVARHLSAGGGGG